jgi:hypothetical protein
MSRVKALYIEGDKALAKFLRDKPELTARDYEDLASIFDGSIEKRRRGQGRGNIDHFRLWLRRDILKDLIKCEEKLKVEGYTSIRKESERRLRNMLSGLPPNEVDELINWIANERKHGKKRAGPKARP